MLAPAVCVRAAAAAVCVLVLLSPGNIGYAAAATSAAAIAAIGPGSVINGFIRFRQGPNCTVLVSGDLSGLGPNGLFGLRVHEAGNLTDGCDSTGALWNPTEAAHGGLSGDGGQAHPGAGDLGNVTSNASGQAAISVSNPVMSSLGLAALYGRSIVVHNLTDVLGSAPAIKANGNSASSSRVACAVIGVASDSAALSADCPGWAMRDAADDGTMSTGIANFVVGGHGSVAGVVQFRTLSNCSIEVVGTVGGLRPNALQASHVHAVGDLTGPCNNTGSHYNPGNASHGSGSDSRSHAGDMGNLRVDGQGSASFNLINPAMAREAAGVSALYGLAVVIHNLTDDLGLGNNSASLSNGNAGTRIACAVIGRALPQSSAAAGSSPGKCRSPPASQQSRAHGLCGGGLWWNAGQAAIAAATVRLLLHFTKR